MAAEAKQTRKTAGSKGRAPSSSPGGGKRPPRTAGKPPQPKTEGIVAQIRTPRFLPFLTIWLLSVAVLAGVVYWGDTSRSTVSKARAKVSSTSGQGSNPQPRPAKPGNSNSDGLSSLPSSKTVGPASLNSKTQTAASHGKPSSGDGPTAPVSDDKLALALPSHSAPQPHAPPPPAPPGPPLAPSLARIAIVIDDFGGDMEIAGKFLALPFPITFSILPYLRHTREVASMARSQDHEVLLHLPMQPLGYPGTDPGKGALLLSMSEHQIARAIETAIESCPHLSGINNHMGSKFTEDADHMRIALRELARRNLFFLDSHTSPRSVAYAVARELGVPSLRRDIFLDHTDTEAAIEAQVGHLVKKAKIQGSAIAIGHPHESTYKVLSRSADLFRKEGIAVVPVSQLIPPGPNGKTKERTDPL